MKQEQELKKTLSDCIKLAGEMDLNIRFFEYSSHQGGTVYAVSSVDRKTDAVVVAFSFLSSKDELHTLLKTPQKVNPNKGKCNAIQRLLNFFINNVQHKYVKTVDWKGHGALAIVEAFNSIPIEDLPLDLKHKRLVLNPILMDFID